MIRHPFLIFSVTIGLLVVGALSYIQSQRFADLFKPVLSRIVAKYVPQDLGIEGDFSEFSIKIFPPGFSLKKPHLALTQDLLGFAGGTSVQAERVDFTFRPFQAFSGNIRIHQVEVYSGSLHLILDKKRRNSSETERAQFSWEELLKFHVESIALTNVLARIEWKDAGEFFETKLKKLQLAQASDIDGKGYQGVLDSEHNKGNVLKKWIATEDFGLARTSFIWGEKGFFLKEFYLLHPGLELSFSGEGRGDVLNSEPLESDFKLSMKGDLAKLAPTPLLGKSEFPLTGLVSFSGGVSGQIDSSLRGLKAEGFLSAKKLSALGWNFDFFQAQGQWEGSPCSGELFLNKVTASSKETERSGGFKPGGGGRVDLGPVRWQVSSNSPVRIPIKFERAHIHWLSGPALKKLYSLNFRLNGSSMLDVSTQNPWEVSAQIDTEVDTFDLDNQKFQMQKPMRTIFRILKAQLSGSVLMNSNFVALNEIHLKYDRSNVFANGKIDFKKGYDLHILGELDVAEEGLFIAENELHGRGTLDGTVRGPSSSIVADLDLNLKDASYLKLLLGDVKGRVIWEDGPNRLSFKNVSGTKNQTSYSLDGNLEVAKIDSIALNVNIPQGNIQDFIQIFDFLLKPLSWFPHSLNGAFSGVLAVTGAPRLSELNVLANFTGSNWEYLGERFRSVHMVGGYDRGSYFISNFLGTKRFGQVLASISLSEKDLLKWDLHTENFLVSDLDLIAQLDFPIRGALSLESSGKGRLGEIQSLTRGELSHLTIRGIPTPPSHFSFVSHSGDSTGMASLMGKQVTMDLKYHFDPTEKSHLKMGLSQFDFSPVLLLFNPKVAEDPSLVGVMSGDIDLSFHAGKFEQASGQASLSQYLLARSNARLELPHPLQIRFDKGDFETEPIALNGREGNASVTLSNRGKVFQGKIQGEIDTAVAEFFTPILNQVDGVSDLDINLGGTLLHPTIYGSIDIDGGAFRVTSLDSPFENVSVDFKIQQNVITVQKFDADLGGGKITASGDVAVFSDRYPQIRLKSALKAAKLKVWPFQFLKLGGALEVQGNSVPYTVGGTLFVDSALSKEKIMNRKQTAGSLKSMQYAPSVTQTGDAHSAFFKLDVAVEALKGIVIQNDLFRDVQAKGLFKIVNTFEAPRLLGSAEIMQGKLLFKDHIFQIQAAKANFDTPRVVNPLVELTATTEVSGNKIQMYVSGRPDKLKFEFSSNPAMQEAEILSLLAVGFTSNDAKKLNASAMSAVQQGEAASLILHSLDFNRDLEDKTGFQVQLDEAVNVQQGISAFRPQSQAEPTVAPQIVIRRRLGDRLSLSAGSTVNNSTSRSNQVNLDYSVSPDFSISGVYNNYGSYGTTADAQLIQNSTGVDFKFQRRFK